MQEGRIYGIDTDFLLKNIGGDTEFLLELLTVFYESRHDTVEKLRMFIEEDDCRGFCETLHTFLGSAANCGAVESSRLGRIVYNKAKSEGLSSVHPSFDDFASEASRMMESLGRQIRNSSS